jgi:hypothetical protein
MSNFKLLLINRIIIIKVVIHYKLNGGTKEY